jgi:hypothetical protein
MLAVATESYASKVIDLATDPKVVDALLNGNSTESEIMNPWIVPIHTG